MANTRLPSHCEPAAVPGGVALCGPERHKPKLRNSCYACSVSKLKCPQEKPTCSRCAKRSLKCEYFVAKPGGRKPSRASGASQAQPRRRQAGGSASGATEVNHAIEADPFAKDTNANAAPVHLPLQHDDGWFHLSACEDPQGGASNALHLPHVLLPPESPNPRPPPALTMDLDTPLAVGHGLSSSSTSSTTNRRMNLADHFSTPFTTDEPDYDLLGATAILFATEDSSDATNESGNCCGTGDMHKSLGCLPFDAEFAPLLDSSAISDFFAVISSDQTRHASRSSPNWEIQHDVTHLSSASHSCFARALRLLERISSDLYTRNPGTPRAAAAIVAENEAVMEEVGSMLGCSCSEDGYLMYIAALITSKALDSYSDVVRQDTCPTLSKGPGRSPAVRTSPGYASASSGPGAGSIIGDDIIGRKDYDRQGVESARMRAQLVLGELYLVRRLIEKLSRKLRRGAAGDEADIVAGVSGSEDGGLAGDTSSPGLLTMGNHLVDALSRRLKSLSLDISRHLRAA